MDINRYNGTVGEYQKEQELINKAIPMLNNTLHSRIQSKLVMRYGFLYDHTMIYVTRKKSRVRNEKIRF